MPMLRPFHLAIPVSNLEEARTFYRETMGCSEGRSDSHWVDFDFYGHQLVIHYNENATDYRKNASNEVDGHDVPIPHFGVVLEWQTWHDLADRLKVWAEDENEQRARQQWKGEIEFLSEASYGIELIHVIGIWEINKLCNGHISSGSSNSSSCSPGNSGRCNTCARVFSSHIKGTLNCIQSIKNTIRVLSNGQNGKGFFQLDTNIGNTKDSPTN